MFSNRKGSNTPPLAIILGCNGTVLTDAEKAFFEKANPLGFILFAWNIESAIQVKALVQSLKEVVQREAVPILIDVEGGRVNRLEKLGYTWPEAASFEILSGAVAAQQKACFDVHQDIAKALKALSISVDCSPVLDVRVPGAHEIIGSRSFSESPDRVGNLGQAAIQGLWAGGVCPVVKHIPGHGAALVDSHDALPVIDLSLEALEKHLAPFQQAMALFDTHPFMAMTAHITYSAVDVSSPTTTSAKVIQTLIRERIGFSGLLMSDDLEMKAMAGSPSVKVQQTLDAGCDIALYARGGIPVWEEALRGARHLSDHALGCLESIFSKLASIA
ncbi:MAG: glycoside hydrolase family 3 N-terminal domain-containing protein [Alphaproteobacteria bacterium]